MSYKVALGKLFRKKVNYTTVQGGDMKFLQSHIYFEMKYLRENSTLIPILGILPNNKHNYLGFLKILTLSLNQGLQKAPKGSAAFVNKDCIHMRPLSGDI